MDGEPSELPEDLRDDLEILHRLIWKMSWFEDWQDYARFHPQESLKSFEPGAWGFRQLFTLGLPLHQDAIACAEREAEWGDFIIVVDKWRGGIKKGCRARPTLYTDSVDFPRECREICACKSVGMLNSGISKSSSSGISPRERRLQSWMRWENSGSSAKMMRSGAPMVLTSELTLRFQKWHWAAWASPRHMPNCLTTSGARKFTTQWQPKGLTFKLSELDFSHHLYQGKIRKRIAAYPWHPWPLQSFVDSKEPFVMKS